MRTQLLLGGVLLGMFVMTVPAEAPFTMNYAGTLMGDSIEFTIDIFGMPVELTVNRS